MREGRREQAPALRRNGRTGERRGVEDVAPYGGTGEEGERGVGDVAPYGDGGDERREQAPALRRDGKRTKNRTENARFFSCARCI